MVLSRFQGRNKTYIHSDPLPFDSMGAKALPAPAPQDSVKGDLFGYSGMVNGYYGGTVGRSGELSYDKYGAAMAYCTVPDVNRAVDLICNAIDSLPFKLIYNDTDDKKNDQTIAESTDPRPRHKLLEAFREVNNENAQSFMWESMYSLLVFGENFIEPLYSKLSMQCTGLNMLNALGVNVIVAGGRILSFNYTLPGGGGTETFEDWELVYDKTKNPFDKFRGLSKVAVTMTKVNILRDIDRFLRDYFQNNAVPDMTVAPKGDDKFSPTDMDRLRDQVRNQLKGAGNQHRVFISPAAAEYNTLDQADLDKQYTVNDPLTRAVFRTFGIPLSMAGDDAGTQYKAGDPVRVGFYQNTIIPAAHDIAKFATNQIVPLFDDTGNVRLEFDTSEFDQISEDDQMRSTVANANYTGGIWKLDEARTYTKKDAVGGAEGNAFLEAPAAPLPFDNAAPGQPEPAALPASTDPLQNEFVQALTGNKSADMAITQTITSTETAAKVAELVNDLTTQIVGKATQSTAEDELRAWERKALKNWKAPFEAVHTAGDLADWITSELTTDAPVIKTVFDTARMKLSFKAIQSTRLDFENEFDDLLGQARAGDADRRSFSATLRYFLNKFGRKAYLDGLQDGGVDTEELDDEDKANIAIMLADQSKYVTDLSAVLFKGDGISDDAAAQKAAMWFNKSVLPMYQAGLVSADGNSMHEWVLGKTEDHCDTCATLAGQRHRLKEYARRGLLPKSSLLKCGGFLCDCKTVKVKGKGRGVWPNASGKSVDLDTLLETAPPDDKKPEDKPKGKVRPERFQFEEYEITNPSDDQKAFDEGKHPRADDGKFGEGSGSAEGDKPEEDTRQYRDFGSFDESMVSDSMQRSAPKPTDKQHAAMEYYRDDAGNADLNRNLRTGKPLSAAGKKHSKELDTLLNDSKLDHDTMVYRGIAPSNPQARIFAEQIKSGQMKPGAVLTDKGYASTTLDSNIANGKFAEDGGVVFKIKAPKGSDGLYMNAASDKFTGKRYDGEFRDEKEVLLPRNSQYKVGKIEKVGNQYVVEMTYEGVGAGV